MRRKSGVAPHMRSGVPEAHPGGCDGNLGRLVDGDAGVIGRRTDGAVPGARDMVRGGILERIGAVVAGDAARAMPVQNGLQPPRNFIHCLLAANGSEAAVRKPLLAPRQALGVVDLFQHLPALDAGVAAVDLVVGVRCQGGEPVVLNRGDHGAVGVAESAVGLYGLGRHRLVPRGDRFMR